MFSAWILCPGVVQVVVFLEEVLLTQDFIKKTEDWLGKVKSLWIIKNIQLFWLIIVGLMSKVLKYLMARS